MAARVYLHMLTLKAASNVPELIQESSTTTIISMVGNHRNSLLPRSPGRGDHLERPRPQPLWPITCGPSSATHAPPEQHAYMTSTVVARARN
jgi:hypothetical protein